MTSTEHHNINAAAVKAQAADLGFLACGISRAEHLDNEARILESWLNRGFHASMHWMERNFEKRVDPTVLVPGARSVISVLFNYFQPYEHPDDPTVAKFSRYAWGDDYHEIVKDRLYELFDWLDTSVKGLNGRVFVDSAPVLDKAWAQRSGLGWIGKNANLLRVQEGSWFFIGEIICDLELDPDGPATDHCGSCTRCVDACPTDAIVEPYLVDANRCISYLTIEHRGDDIDPALQADMANWVFGCDICQDVCPWNSFATPTGEQTFMPDPDILETRLETWMELDLASFRERFRHSAVKRTKHEGLLRNVRIANRNVR